MTDSSPPPVFLGFKADGEFVAALDQGRGIKSRSQFVRESVAEKLEAMNIRLPSSAINAPDRTGKGGPKPRINRVMVLNESTKQTEELQHPVHYPTALANKRKSRKKRSQTEE